MIRQQWILARIVLAGTIASLNVGSNSSRCDAAEHVPPHRLNFEGYGPNHFETTFWELRPRRLAPRNTYTGVGVPGHPLIGFGSAMRARYSEFDMRFTLRENDSQESLPFNVAGFKQYSPGDWLPGIVSEWETDQIHYKVTFISVPTDAKPVDLYHIELRNVGAAAARSKLLVTVDGAPTLEADSELIGDRNKPLVIMDPPVPAKRLARDAGVVDPRTTASCSWGPGTPLIDRWKTHRTGWYGMPIEYLLKSEKDEPLQVFVGLSNDPVIHDVNWDIPDKQKDPVIMKLYEDPGQEVTVNVEGDKTIQEVKAGVGQDRKTLRFLGRDSDGDGYIKVSVQATPASLGPSVLAMLWAFDKNAKVSASDLSSNQNAQPVERVTNEIYDRSKVDHQVDRIPDPKHIIDVGADLMWGVSAELQNIGKDPTVYAQQLSYEEEIPAGQTKTYLLRLPAIDRPETEPYGWLFRPYDTGTSWMRPLAARFPNNNADYGRDVPPGQDPGEYAVNGTQPRTVWQQQETLARSVSWYDANAKLKSFWDAKVSGRAKFISPEPYLDHLYKHAVATLDLCRQRIGSTPHEVQLVGPDWYWDACAARDFPYMAMAWDWSGHSQISRTLWGTSLTQSSELPESRWNLGQWSGGPDHDGLWLTRDAQWSSQGQTLWGTHAHYLLSGDKEWLQSHYPKLRRGAEWIIRAIEREKKRLGDPSALGYGTMPVAGPEDGGPGHNYYVNAFTLLGLRMAAESAEVLGETDDAKRWQVAAESLHLAFKEIMHRGFFRFNDFAGTLPAYPEWYPGPDYQTEKDGEKYSTVQPDTSFGTALVWPTDAVAPYNPIMHGWFRNREHQGAKSAGLYGWPYIQVGGAISYISRGEPDRACDWFYAWVNHASGTLEWGEGISAQADSRDIGTGGQMPHNWATGMYIAFLRHLFLMEQGTDTLHLAPATPRHWLSQPDAIGVEDAPTNFGPVTYHLRKISPTEIEGDVHLDPQRKPPRLVIHVRGPGGRGIEEAFVNGQPSKHYVGDAIVIPVPPQRISLKVTYSGE